MSSKENSRIFSFMQAEQLPFLEELYGKYLKDPTSVEGSWRHFFDGVAFAELKVPSEKEKLGDVRIFHLIDAYRRFGHLQAKTNPIKENPPCHELLLSSLGFDEKELSDSFPTNGLMSKNKASLAEIIHVLEEIYCGTIGMEYMGKHSPELETWMQSQIEPTHSKPNFSRSKKEDIFHALNKAELFETFLHTKYVGQKRFSLEGAETLIPILSTIIDEGAEMGMDELVIGMSHRGRLNVLTNILDKSYSMVFSEFEDFVDPELAEGAGDVKYHKGFSSNVETKSKKQVHISLTANPSHLESVDPVVEGKVRAKQVQRGDTEKSRVIPLLIHGDASLAGQGIVYETLQLYNIPGYGNGGTFHIVINNQIGFTTIPSEYTSTRYCSDIAHAFQFPVFHVNAEDPEGCVYAAELALKIRQLFHIDVFIVLNSYRKYGHNESDEPAFTQPVEYRDIREKKSIREIYRDTLIQQGIVEKEIAVTLEEEFKKALHYELEELKLKKEAAPIEAFGGVWKEYRKAAKGELLEPVVTAVPLSVLQEVGEKFCQIPDGFEVHPKLVRLVEHRRKMIRGEIPLDFAMAEHLAFGTLLWEGVHVRLSGQDSQRGTFTQRHAVWVDQKTNKRYFPLAHLKESQGLFNVYNSILSEFGVLGFEFGYSLAYPSALVLWEAQFGDFANGGQIVFDQYCACSEQKWNRYSGLVILLPHGYEGQGSEHSSGRIERFLQLSAESNMQVTYPTTPAQYFHLLRRQVKRRIRIPLVVFTPKGLLRHPKAVSNIEDLTKGTFQEILNETKNNKPVSRLLFCTGRIFYDLLAEKEKRKKDEVAIVRIEQLYPLHRDKLTQLLEKYADVKQIYWVQEEPQNMGSYHYLYPILHQLLGPNKRLQYVGRRTSASSATGFHHKHEKEQKEVMDMALDGSP